MKRKLFFSIISLITILATSYYFYKKNSSSEYITADNKKYGSFEIIKNDNYILADFNSNNNEINKIIREEQESFLTSLSNKKDLVIDFNSDIFFNNIAQISYFAKEKNNLISEKNILVNLSTTEKLEYTDIIRDNNLLLQDHFPNVDLKSIDKTKLKLTNENLIIGNNDNNIVIKINEMKNIFKSGTGLPSLYEGEKLVRKIFPKPKGNKLIAITFDDGPLNDYHIKIRNLFNKYNIPATFYVIGNLVDNNPAVIKDTYLAGHTIANHSYTHPGLPNYNLKTLDSSSLRKELELTDDAIFKAIGIDPTTARPPGGYTNGYVESHTNLPMILWDVDSNDWRFKNNSKKIYHNVKEHIKPNSIVLFHDIYPGTYEALLKLIPKLLEEGYEFVDVDTLLEYRKKSQV